MALNYTLPQLLKSMQDQNASDLHLCVGSPPRLRIDSKVVPLKLDPLTAEEAQFLCQSILTESQKKELDTNRQVDLAFSVKQLGRFRANVYFERNSFAAAFRAIAARAYQLKELNLPPVVEKLCNLTRGLVLVTGPTGSGKSTTLTAMINHINENRFAHMVTLEDPIEFIHTHKNSIINQREIGTDTLSLADAMKAALRQDPDIVLVGELRDTRSISSALSIAETGHVVFSTLHTNGAVSTINRMVDAFPPEQQQQVRIQLAMTLEAVLSQTLIPLQGGGRAMVLEVLRVTTPVRALIFEGKVNQIYSAMQMGQEDSLMQTMNQGLMKLVEKKQISQDTALLYSSNPEELMELINRSLGQRALPPRKGF